MFYHFSHNFISHLYNINIIYKINYKNIICIIKKYKLCLFFYIIKEDLNLLECMY